LPCRYGQNGFISEFFWGIRRPKGGGATRRSSLFARLLRPLCGLASGGYAATAPHRYACTSKQVVNLKPPLLRIAMPCKRYLNQKAPPAPSAGSAFS